MPPVALADKSITPATARVLWAASRPDVDVDAVVAEIDAGADLELAATIALANRVGPLYWRAIVAAQAEALVGPTVQLLEQEANLRRAQSRVLLPLALARIVEPLRAEGLEPLIFKGPAVAVHYPDAGIRAMDDIDVILPAEVHAAGLRALTRSGWQQVRHQRTEVPRAHDNYDTVLLHPEIPQLPLELHWDLASWHERATGIRAAELWRSRRATTMFGVDAFSLPPEEDLVALANHAGKPFHNFGRLVWSVDLVVVIAAARGGVDWDRVSWLADRWHCRTVLAVALHHARRLGADVPDALMSLPAGHRREPISQLVAATWPFLVPDDQMAYELRYAFADSRLRRAELLFGELVFGAPTRQIPGRAVRLASQVAKRWWNDRRGDLSTEAP